uniref:Uroporphyrinogen-III synthase n=1 Tax=Candidatus Kentrum eta TaxID=2126337 RepID=A0A450UAF2_9GAMM|nr:MAG: uroporphyrinogen-III synthase [Candidatus Kentron sp. H]VFJ89062.1 MAG: uroporphyrinogen-III synthase [Candidatus Kentron sp. H]VFJ95754.1 MAG: uroporphyrinogen-III synthase [Candidatus Kentron sp. H]
MRLFAPALENDLPNEMTTGRLTGLGVWVTRPRHQAHALAERIEAEGGQAIRLPVIAIEDVDDPETVRALVASLDSFHLAIFVSANAVARGLGYVFPHGRHSEPDGQGTPGTPSGAGRLGSKREHWPASVRVAAIGKATARALASAGLPCTVQAAPPYNSESLLTAPALQTEAIAGCRVIIFRGVGGRALLGETLAARGARVTYAEVYRRTLPPWRQTTPIPWDRIGVIVATSGEGLENLFAMMPDDEARQRLRETPLVVISGRMAELAHGLGYRRAPIIAESASDEAILSALFAGAQGVDGMGPPPSSNGP